MVILHGFLALVAGFVVMAAPVIALTALLMKNAPGWVGPPGHPRPAYMLVNAGCSFIAAAAGGYVTTWIASENPLAIVLALAIVVVVLSAISALEGRGRQPLGYRIALLVLSPVGVVAGGLLRLHVLGLRWAGFK